MIYRNIKIYGTVQSVGFRPAVYSYAKKHNVLGSVRNMGSYVSVKCAADKVNFDRFLYDVINNPPKNANIAKYEITEGSSENFTDFIIEESQNDSGSIYISPDIAMCENCLKEFNSINDRRYGYAFINCTDCGPRWTITDNIPYDRANTSMKEFYMCSDCEKEYKDPSDRRYHAEPVCCEKCGPIIEFNGNSENALQNFCRYIEEGKILALKGIGGYHICCDAYNENAVSLLRERKHRYKKPLAVMAKDLMTAKKLACIGETEEKILTGREAPIVLLKKSENYNLAESISDTEKIGIMLPYAPLHYLIFRYLKCNVLVMTSGNISDEPIAYEDWDAKERLKDICDGFLSHTRKIYTRTDDSVVSAAENRLYPIRLGRGYIPKIFAYNKGAKPEILACGSLLKNTFSLYKDGNIYLSSHIGDLEEGISFDYYLSQTELYKKIFCIKPDLLVCDSHPDYINSKWARESSIPFTEVQHHKAHGVSAMVQNGLSEAICVTYDGTGYGDDGMIWGGEIFAGRINDLKRTAHLKPVKISGVNSFSGEKISPFKCLVPYLNENDDYLLKNNLNYEYKMLKATEKINSFETTSMGRFFDAVSSLVLNIKNIDYEGEAPIRLEQTADREEKGIYDYSVENYTVNQYDIIEQIKRDLYNNISISKISGKFHNTVSDFTLNLCRKISLDTGIKDVTLSGGVFMNEFLLNRLIKAFSETDMKLYLCHEIPANDGGISFGQICMALENI